MYRSVCSLIVVVFGWLPTLQDHIKDIIGVFLPLGREEWNYIACRTFPLRLKLSIFRATHKVGALPVLFNISLHARVLTSIFLLLKVAVLAKNLAS